MIIGRDLMSDLKMDVKFSTQTIEWEDSEIPLKDSGASMAEAYYVRDSEAVDDAQCDLKAS